MQWYVLKVASNKEKKVKDSLQMRVDMQGLDDIIGRIEVPVEQVKRIRGSKQTVYEKKLYPGYVFMEMEVTNESKVPDRAWFMIREVVGAGDFINTGGIPTPMKDTDVARILHEVSTPDDTPIIKVDFEKDDRIKIREGAFESFEGVVDSIDQERGIVKVIVSIFGRSTPLDIEYWQIEKI